MAKTLRKTAEEKNRNPWKWVLIVFLFIFLFAAIAIVIISVLHQSDKLPNNIDVVIYDEDRNRRDTQIKAILKHMSFLKQLFVISFDPPLVNTYDPKVKFVTFSSSGTRESKMNEAIEFIPTIPGINSDAIFLGDSTYPFSDIKKTFLFFGDQPRIFNFLRNEPEKTYFSQYYEYTGPSFVMDVKLLEESQTITQLMFLSYTEERAVLKNALNRDVFVFSGDIDNAEKQFSILSENKPLFATFHLSGDLDTSNTKLNEYLGTKFV